ncbi:MAG: hypothetical protein PHI63_01865 [Patescibacteria group bacterium]|nr:hypothetical protein [Patescibacteria group bacterium]
MANFLFWMTLIGLSIAAFSALMAITEITIDFATTKIITVWQPLGASANPCAPAGTAGQGARLAPQPYATLQMGGYTFSNPGTWLAQTQPTLVRLNRVNPAELVAVPSSQVTFLSPEGKMVATLNCPAQEINYPLANFSTEIRQFERDGVMYTAILRTGLANAQNPAAGRVAFIFVQPVNIFEGLDVSCQILSTPTGAADMESFRRVYQSLR